MAYDPENPPSLIAQGVGGPVGLRWFALMWVDPIASILVPGYISNAEEIGMRAGDGLIYKDINRGEWDHYDLIVDAIAANGSATIKFPEVPEEGVPLVADLGADPTVQAVIFQNGRMSRAPAENLNYFGVATQAQAEAGVENTVRMTPLRTAQAIAARVFTVFGVWIAGLTSKATPVDADDLVISDSAAADVQKRLSWANLKATLKTYFDTLYPALTTGSWTPAITFGGAAVGVDYGTQAGSYTRFDNVAICSFNLVLTSKGSSVGAVLITGLPFILSNGGMSIKSYDGFTGLTGMLIADPQTGTSTMQLKQSGAVSSGAISDANVSNTMSLTGIVVLRGLT